MKEERICDRWKREYGRGGRGMWERWKREYGIHGRGNKGEVEEGIHERWNREYGRGGRGKMGETEEKMEEMEVGSERDISGYVVEVEIGR